MAQALVSERRGSSRHRLLLPWPVSTEIDGKKIEAEMIDVSTRGAKIRLAGLSSPNIIVPGTEHIWDVCMPSGNTVAITISSRWIHRFPEGYVVGVLFDANEMISSEISRLHNNLD